MRAVLAVIASGLAFLAAIVSAATRDEDFIAFFVALGLAAAMVAWLVGPGQRFARARTIARGGRGRLGDRGDLGRTPPALVAGDVCVFVR